MNEFIFASLLALVGLYESLANDSEDRTLR
jgi:hypothetical protein